MGVGVVVLAFEMSLHVEAGWVGLVGKGRAKGFIKSQKGLDWDQTKHQRKTERKEANAAADQGDTTPPPHCFVSFA